MIGSINNFEVFSHERENGETKITFIFDTPTGNLGGYVLYMGYNTNVFNQAKFRVDIDHEGLNEDETDLLVTRLNKKVYFEYTVPSVDDGKILYFKIKAISKYKEESSFSNILEFHNYITSISNLRGLYDNYEITLTWDDLDNSNNKNVIFKDYSLFRHKIKGLSNFILIDATLQHPEFIVGKNVWITDVYTRTYWYGKVTTKGYFELEDSNKIYDTIEYTGVVTALVTDEEFNISPPIPTTFTYKNATCTVGGVNKNMIEDLDRNSTHVVIENVVNIEVGQEVKIIENIYRISDVDSIINLSQKNLNVYIEEDDPYFIGSTTNNQYVDTTFSKDNSYIYKVYSKNDQDFLSEATSYPIYTLSMLKAFPILRNPNNSRTELVSNSFWKLMKNALVDKNYYKKEKWDIPYLTNKKTHFKGFLGVGNCKVDIFINDIYDHTTTTDSYGEFDIKFQYPKGKTKLQIQCRDKFNIDFSRHSTPYQIRTLQVYTHYAIQSSIIEEYIEELSKIQSDINIFDSRYTTFLDKYAPLIEIYKSGEETDEEFIDIASTIFEAYETAGYDKSTKMVLDKFVENIDALDNYELYFRNSLYDSIITGKSFIPNNPQLERNNLYYAITATNGTGEETAATIIRIDNRWWPFNYYGYNVLMWNENYDSRYYNIYRGTTEEDLGFMLQVDGNVFVDNGTIVPNTTIQPPEYNYSGINLVSGFHNYMATKLSQIQMLYKKLANTVIMLFCNEDEEIPEFQLTRMKLLFTKLIPPEIRYTMIVVRDSEIYIYPDEITITPEEPLVYALYDQSFYDSSEVYS